MNLHQILGYFLHLDRTLNDAAKSMGPGVYLLLFAIVFCETGLVVTPFLPGDSLLFAVGALAATGGPIKLAIVLPLLCIAANCGDLLNYAIGYRVGPSVFSKNSSRLLNKKHLLKAQEFYDRHGRPTIILARFVPIIRTFAPFVAGIGRMRFSRFFGFSVAGGVLWVASMSLCGYLFGGIPWVKTHFQIVVLAVIFISLIPAMIHILARKKSPAPAGTTEATESTAR